LVKAVVVEISDRKAASFMGYPTVPGVSNLKNRDASDPVSHYRQLVPSLINQVAGACGLHEVLVEGEHVVARNVVDIAFPDESKGGGNLGCAQFVHTPAVASPTPVL
jgi:hypothetical protein